MQVISLFTSGVMLGLKLAQVTALPAMWGKLSKWRSRAQPLCEAADPEGTELHQAPADTTDAPFTAEEYMTTLLKIEADILLLAKKTRVTADKMQLHKLAHKFEMLAADATVPSAKSKAKSGATRAGPKVPSRSCTYGLSTGTHRHAHIRLLRRCRANTSRAAFKRGAVCARRLRLLRRVRAKRNPRSCSSAPAHSASQCVALRSRGSHGTRDRGLHASLVNPSRMALAEDWRGNAARSCRALGSVAALDGCRSCTASSGVAKRRRRRQSSLWSKPPSLLGIAILIVPAPCVGSRLRSSSTKSRCSSAGS